MRSRLHDAGHLPGKDTVQYEEDKHIRRLSAGYKYYLILFFILAATCIALSSRQNAVRDLSTDAINLEQNMTRISRGLMDQRDTLQFKIVVSEMFEKYAQIQRIKLNANRSQEKSIFEDVEISYPFSTYMFQKGDGIGGVKKGMIRPDIIFPPSKKCVVYGMGIAEDSSFEIEMTSFCEVHGFDCTVDPKASSVSSKPFMFHPQCIGREPVVANTVYMNNASRYQYISLAQAMANLRHAAVDVLKFDIEGGEWAVLEGDILGRATRPAQLIFELHTHCANPNFVPRALTRGRDKAAVNRLFAALHDAGYRVASKEVNNGDPCCAEFVLVINATLTAPRSPRAE